MRLHFQKLLISYEKTASFDIKVRQMSLKALSFLQKSPKNDI